MKLVAVAVALTTSPAWAASPSHPALNTPSAWATLYPLHPAFDHGNHLTTHAYSSADRVKFTDIKALTFREGIEDIAYEPTSPTQLSTNNAIITKSRKNFYQPACCTSATDEMHQRSMPTVPNQNDTVSECGRRWN